MALRKLRRQGAQLFMSCGEISLKPRQKQEKLAPDTQQSLLQLRLSQNIHRCALNSSIAAALASKLSK